MAILRHFARSKKTWPLGLVIAAVIFCMAVHRSYVNRFLLPRVRRPLRTHVGDIDAGAVPCGFGRAIGNKVCIS